MGAFNQQSHDEAEQDPIDFEEAELSEEEQQSLSLSAVAGSDDLQLDSAYESKGVLGNSAILLGLVVVLSAGSLWGMRVFMSRTSDGQIDQQLIGRIEAFIASQESSNQTKVGNEQDQTSGIDIEATKRLLERPWIGREIPVGGLAKNPFIIARSEKEQEVDIEAEREKIQMQLDSKVANLRLEAVMAGASPIAMINSQMYQEGQYVDGFLVNHISDAVNLSHPNLPGVLFRLEMK